MILLFFILRSFWITFSSSLVLKKILKCTLQSAHCLMILPSPSVTPVLILLSTAPDINPLIQPLCLPVTCLAGTWLRQTLRTPPSGWGLASVPRCSLCWASPCTEHFSNSGDQTARDASSTPSLSWLCPLPPIWKTKKNLKTKKKTGWPIEQWTKLHFSFLLNALWTRNK